MIRLCREVVRMVVSQNWAGRWGGGGDKLTRAKRFGEKEEEKPKTKVKERPSKG